MSDVCHTPELSDEKKPHIKRRKSDSHLHTSSFTISSLFSHIPYANVGTDQSFITRLIQSIQTSFASSLAIVYQDGSTSLRTSKEIDKFGKKNPFDIILSLAVLCITNDPEPSCFLLPITPKTGGDTMYHILDVFNQKEKVKQKKWVGNGQSGSWMIGGANVCFDYKVLFFEEQFNLQINLFSIQINLECIGDVKSSSSKFG
jgi:hypothetical protein